MPLFLPSLKQSGHLERIRMTIGIIGSRKLKEFSEDYATQGWDIFAPHLSIYGFDADAEACHQMNTEIAAQENNWIEHHFPCALWNTNGKATLYKTRNPACTSLYPPNSDYTERFTTNAIMMELVDTEEINVSTLDSFLTEHSDICFDYLQIDVQGGDLNVLEGATNTLEKSVLAMSVEVEFFQLYQNQPLFGDVDNYLRKKGFTIFDIGKIYRANRQLAAVMSHNHPGQPIWSDVYYVRDLIQSDINNQSRNPEQIFKLACIADTLNFIDYSMELLVYLTLNYGTSEDYNFADTIIDSLGQVPELADRDVEELPGVAEILPYTTLYNL